MRIAGLALAGFLVWHPSVAATVRLEPDRDATLIESPDGSRANGAGPAFFAGRTNQNNDSIRRALIRFDVSRALPARVLIERVSLTLSMNPSNPGRRTLRLFRVLEDWGEGASAASGGGGAPAGPGDVTWLHTFWDADFWTHPGGLFAGHETAALDVDAEGSYTWQGTVHMVADVRLWAVSPRRNFGWILVGDETVSQSVKSFASRENPDPELRPVLEITYR